MKRIISNIFLALAIFISATMFVDGFIAPAEADPNDAAPDSSAIVFSPQIVTANRWGASPDSLIYPVYSLTGAELLALPARDAAEAVETLPGVIVSNTGGPNSVAFTSIQGSAFYQTIVLIDGVPLNDMMNGLGNIGQIDSSQIDKVEVAHGSVGAIWGSAMGGVVNIMTNNPRQGNFARANIGGGEYGASSLNAMANASAGALAASGGGSYRKSTGPESAGSRGESVSNGFLNANFSSGAGLFWLKSRTYQGEVGTGQYKGVLDGYWENTVFKTNSVSGGYDGGAGPVKLKAQAYNQTQNYIVQQNQEPTGRLGDSATDDTVTGGSLIGRIGEDDSALTIGVEGKNGTVKAAYMPKPEYSISSAGAFANIHRHIGGMDLEASVRQSNEDTFGSFTGFGAGVSWRALEAVTLRASVSRGYTAPPLGYRFNEYPGWSKANPDLTTEKALTWQAGAKFLLGSTTAVELNGFFANVTDAIAITYDDEGISMYKNFDEFERKGVNASFDTKVDNYHFRLNALYQETYDKKAGELVKDLPRSSFNARIGYNDGRLAAYLLGSRTESVFSADSNGKDGEWVAGAKISYTHVMENKANITVGAGVYNMTDARLYDHELLPQTYPRQAEATVSVAF